MSVTRHLACDDCKEYLWIGQGGDPPKIGTFYSGEPHTMKALGIFLFKHYEHALRFVPEWYENYFHGWSEIDSNNYKTHATHK